MKVSSIVLILQFKENFFLFLKYFKLDRVASVWKYWKMYRVAQLWWNIQEKLSHLQSVVIAWETWKVKTFFHSIFWNLAAIYLHGYFVNRKLYLHDYHTKQLHFLFLPLTYIRILFVLYLECDDFYFASLGGGLMLDAKHMGSVARFANHSCEPNCELQKWSVLGTLIPILLCAELNPSSIWVLLFLINHS